MGSSTIANADHTYKTSIVKKVLPSVVEVHAEKTHNMGADPKENQGGFKNRNQPRNQPQQRRNPKQDPQHMGSGFVIKGNT